MSASAPRIAPAWALVGGGELVTLVFLAPAVLAWGGLGPFLAHPARAATAAWCLGLVFAAGISGTDLSVGRRESAGSRRAFMPFVALMILTAWVPAVSDRHELWTIDGDAARWLGLGLVVVGGVLRVWPMFALGRRFSPFVAIQEGHTLRTDGPYRWVRNPSYLGGLTFVAGWGLVFRSAIGVALVVPALWMTLDRIRDEEALLASEFGAEWVAYRARTWRLVPFLY